MLLEKGKNDPGMDLEFLCLLPEQFYDLTRRRRVLEGELRLLFAVLEDAIACYLRKRNSNRAKELVLSQEAELWIKGASDDGPFSYETICETLGIEPSRLRVALERLAENQTSGEDERMRAVDIDAEIPFAMSAGASLSCPGELSRMR